MARTYTLKRRAEQQADTRRRIVEAAVDLHGTLGPARTSLSMVAERAGVQRNTLYAHFPDERSLAMACSAHFFETEPPPQAEDWREAADKAEQLRTALGAIYRWFARNETLMACVLRDAEHHAPTREISELRFGPTVQGWHSVLGEGLGPAQAAMLHLALSFHGWRAVAREAKLGDQAAAELMAAAIQSAG